jgi:excisionase family DNA binding protein
MLEDKWIGLDEAADYLGVKPATLRSWIRRETGVPAHKVGKFWKFKRSELDEWVRSGKGKGE